MYCCPPTLKSDKCAIWKYFNLNKIWQENKGTLLTVLCNCGLVQPNAEEEHGIHLFQILYLCRTPNVKQKLDILHTSRILLIRFKTWWRAGQMLAVGYYHWIYTALVWRVVLKITATSVCDSKCSAWSSFWGDVITASSWARTHLILKCVLKRSSHLDTTETQVRDDVWRRARGAR